MTGSQNQQQWLPVKDKLLLKSVPFRGLVFEDGMNERY